MRGCLCVQYGLAGRTGVRLDAKQGVCQERCVRDVQPKTDEDEMPFWTTTRRGLVGWSLIIRQTNQGV